MPPGGGRFAAAGGAAMTARQERLTQFFGISLPLLGIIFSTRYVIDASTRLFFTFVPQFANGLGLSLTGFGWLMFLRAVLGISGPIFGAAADRFGRRQVMALALLLQATAAISLMFLRGWWGLFSMGLSGLSLAAFVPAQQAYVSEQAAARRRGRVMGAVELSWSLTALVASPLMGWLIEAVDWRAPLLLLAVLYGVATAVILRLPPTAVHHSQSSLSRLEIGHLLLRKNVLASVLVAFLVYVAVTCFLTVTGVWLTVDFGLDAAALGVVSTLIGVAELAGAGASSLLIDWIGKWRGNVVGLLLLAVAFATLPLLPSIVALIIAMLAVTGLLFQFVIVSLLPLYAEQVIEARGTVLALAFMGVGLGAAVGPLLTAVLWQRYQILGVSVVGVVCLLVALGLVVRFLRETAVAPVQLPNT
ncbi:MAG: MFS transporter [Ardenticatenaceae bacterium]|nr:MFS transporter [Anaerolineales bacterium]MCB8921616.1 MFS transporter [Ardenticatenaceae bacterium]MCB9003351.1 MFS transporter [Ardenticatenaceae bacterium]